MCSLFQQFYYVIIASLVFELAHIFYVFYNNTHVYVQLQMNIYLIMWWLILFAYTKQGYTNI